MTKIVHLRPKTNRTLAAIMTIVVVMYLVTPGTGATWDAWDYAKVIVGSIAATLTLPFTPAVQIWAAGGASAAVDVVERSHKKCSSKRYSSSCYPKDSLWTGAP